uniref:Glutathione peroxidase n=1 Tax=Xiphophorus couchianus TaxID=32473 RepID=A0A3B5L716_9TELE
MVKKAQQLLFLPHFVNSFLSFSLCNRTRMAYKSIYDFSAETLEGEEVPLSIYKGKVLLIVNVATF